MSTDGVAVDANVLVYALYHGSAQHVASRAFLERAQRGVVKLCLTSQILAEFFSIVTNAKRVSHPRTPDEAAAAIEAILAIPGVVLLPLSPEVTWRWVEMLRRHPVRGGAVFDLQLIATISVNGVQQICTFNRQDFEGFPGLQIVAP